MGEIPPDMEGKYDGVHREESEKTRRESKGAPMDIETFITIACE